MKTLLIIWIILGLICVVIEFIKDHIEIFVGIVVIILAIIVIRILLPIIAPLLPYMMLMIAIYIIVRMINNRAMRKKAYLYLKWLEDVGIDKPKITPEYERVFKWIKKQNYIELFLSDYIISVGFYKKIMNCFDQVQEMSDTEFQKCCFDMAPYFRLDYTKPLLDFLQRKNNIFQFPSLDKGKYHYVSAKLINECICLFEDEGAATEDEFAEICRKILITPFLNKEYFQLAKYVLGNMYLCGLVQKVNLNTEDFNDVDLYIAKKQKPNSKMKRVTINMDN